MDYLLVKWLHVLSATILFGTGIGSAFFMFTACRRRQLEAMRIAIRHVVLADWVFTTPAVIFQLASGLWLAHLAGLDLRAGWLAGALALYLFAGACWLPVVWLQIRMRALAETAADVAALPARFWRMFAWWTALGTLAFPAVLLVFWLMVVKPG